MKSDQPCVSVASSVEIIFAYQDCDWTTVQRLCSRRIIKAVRWNVERSVLDDLPTILVIEDDMFIQHMVETALLD